MTKDEFIKELRQGNRSAYKHLFTEYYAWLCNYLYKLTNDTSLSEDLVQEVFINLWEKRKKITITTSLKNYLFKSCHNQFLQYVRKEKVRTDFLNTIRWDVIFETYESEADELYDFKIKKLNSLINELPPKCKEIFIKNKLQKKKYKEIASELNISIKTVENQMSKALRFLKENATSFML